jgi:hypothetical protein
MRGNWPRGQDAHGKAAWEIDLVEEFQMAKEKWDPRPLMDYIAASDEAMRSFTIRRPANIDMSSTEDRELVQLLSLHVAAGSLYEAQPGVFKYTPEGMENLKEEARRSRQKRLENERMIRN